MKKLIILIFTIFFMVCFTASLILAASSVCEKFPARLVGGEGPLPYNYRIIDGHVHAGGHPLNPKGFKNSDRQVLAILNYLKGKGVTCIIDLDNTKGIQVRYSLLLKKAGLTRLHVPMNSEKVPTEAEWKVMKEKMRGKVYVHCRWGADRTGAVIARYLVEEKGYSPRQAFYAVITGGSHAGVLGGLKRISMNRNLVLFFCKDPKLARELIP